MKLIAKIAFPIFIFQILFAHEGHDHGSVGESGTGSGSVLKLTSDSVKNLGIETVTLDIKSLRKKISLVAVAEAPPNKEARIFPRTSGRISEITARPGDSISEGGELLKVESLTFGNTPVVIRSPISGRVARIFGTVGQTVTPETLLSEVIDLSQMVVRGKSYERSDILDIQKGNRGTATSEIYPGKEFPGVVLWVEPGFDSESRTLQVGVLVNNAGQKLRGGMQMSLSIEVGGVEEVISVPKRALLGETGSYFVFVGDSTDKNQFEKRSVVIGDTFGNEIEIREGVFPGEDVVVQGNYQLQYATSLPPSKASTKDSMPSKSFLKKTWFWLICALFVLSSVILFVWFRSRLGRRSKSAWSGN